MFGFGALGEHPLGDYGFTGPPVNISLPALTLDLTLSPIAVRAGKRVGLPPVELQLDPLPVAVRVGKRVGLPAIELAVEMPPIFVGISANVNLPAYTLQLDIPPLAARAGKRISLHDTVRATYDLGALGEDALGGFAMGEGEPFTLDFVRPLQLRIEVPDLAVQAGKHVALPPVNLTIEPTTLQVGARRRRLKTSGVAS
jgi:hypothetical protein